MIILSTSKGDFSFQSADDALNFVRTTAQENSEIWIGGEYPYPCMTVCTNGEYAAINYFENDTGDMWLSYNAVNQEEVTFIASGEEWRPDASAVIRLSSALSCVREFCIALKKPACIQWQEL